MARLQRPPRQQSSASDSNLRCHEGEWFRLQRPWRLRGPLPIPFSAAAKENGSACNGRGGYEVRVRFHSSLPRRRMVPPAERHYPTDASILDFGPKLANRCKVFPVYALLRAVILDLRGSIWESLQVFARKRPPACSDSGFHRSNLAIAASFPPETAQSLQ